MRTTRRRYRWRLTLLLATLAAASGCAPESDLPGGQALYRHSLPGVPADLDPAHSGDRYSAFITQNLFQTLFVYRYLARPYRLKPSLAADFPDISADGLRYLIRIRPGQRFADDPAFTDGAGREVVAADVVYSLMRHFDPATRSQGQWLWRGRIAGLDAWAAGVDAEAPVAGLKVLDRYRLEIRLTAPYPALLHTLANPLSAVVPREAVARYGREFGVNPVGSGPYRLASFDSGRALLVRNSNYGPTTLDLESEGYQPERHRDFGLESLDGLKLPLIERVGVDFIPDDAARWLAFNSAAGIQFLRLPADQVGELLADPIAGRLKTEYRAALQAAPAPELGFVRLDFNFADPSIGGDPDSGRAEERRRLRCALAATVDWDERNRIFYQGLGIVIDALAPPATGAPGAIPARRRAPPALAELDLRPAPPLSYGHLAGVRGRQEYAFFRDALVAAGYPESRIAARSYPNLSALARGIANAEINVYVLGWVMDYPDPINNFELFYGPNTLPGANYSQYRNPEYDALFEQASATAPSPARDQLLERLQALLDRDCVTVPGLVRRSVFVFRREVAVYPDNGPLNGTLLRYVGWRQ